MKRKYLAAVAIAVIAVTISACGNKAENSAEELAVTPKTTAEQAVMPQTAAEPAAVEPAAVEPAAASQDTAVNNTETGGKQAAPQQQNAQADTNAAAAGTTAITETQAKEIALQHAQAAEADATFLRVKLDYDDGVQVYEVEFYVLNKEYDYEIDAADGTIRSFDYDIENYTPAQTAGGTGTQSQAAVSIEDARKSALAKVSGAKDTDISIKQDHDDGKAVYEGKIIYNNMEYDFEIDAATGTFTEWEEESVFD